MAADRYLADLSCTFLTETDNGRPLWTGDVIRLVLEGGSEYEDYRILGIPEAEFVREYLLEEVQDGSIPVRVASYRGELIGEGTVE